jgi:hypothetical protein
MDRLVADIEIPDQRGNPVRPVQRFTELAQVFNRGRRQGLGRWVGDR